MSSTDDQQPARDPATLVYVGFNLRIAALDRETGEVAWTWKSPQGTGIPILLVDGDRLIVSIQGYTYCLDPRCGDELWRNPLKGMGLGTPAWPRHAATARRNFTPCWPRWSTNNNRPPTPPPRRNSLARPRSNDIQCARVAHADLPTRSHSMNKTASIVSLLALVASGLNSATCVLPTMRRLPASSRSSMARI